MEEVAAKENSAPPARAAPVLGVKRRPAFNAPAFVKKPALTTGAGPKPGAPAARPTAPVARPATAAAAAVASAGASGSRQAPNPAAGDARYFTVLYCKYQPSKKLRKNKSFADGVLEVAVDTKRAVLMDSEGKTVSATTLRGVNVPTMGGGSCVVVGAWEVEVEDSMDANKFKSGEAFLKPTADAVAIAALAAAPAAYRAPAAGGGGGFKPPAGGGGGFKRPGAPGGSAAAAAAAAAEPPKAFLLHDPHAEGAVLLNSGQWAGGRGMLAQDRPVSPVVVDPYLARHLRPHQVSGVKFLYEATMGLRAPGMFGCILADDMGLGKTLQVLALLWTLLKQGPEGKPTVRKAMVVTPSSLCQNWADEARKWLGVERMRVMVLSPGPDGKQQVVDFKHGSVHRVVVVSYETLRKHAAELAGCMDLLVCDEGHRLKSAQGNKTISALTSLNCQRRVILTGTPIQNDLTEFFAMVSFVNPDALGSLQAFERVMAAPINRSRDRNASEAERELGATRSAELGRRVEQFVLRRTREVNARYLPPLTNLVVFCKPSELQLRVYSAVLGSSSVRKMLNTTGADFGDQALTVLTNLRKICNHPSLCPPAALVPGEGSAGGAAAAAAAAATAAAVAAAAGEGGEEFDPDQSGKMAVLGVLLHESINVAGDRMVVVSQSTAALDLVQKLCDGRGFKTVRIDGGTDVSKRQDVVNAFNSYEVGQVFLLSTTAGGAGLNLTGANRLVLLDSHWNPAMDLQAMARVWRDGQKKPCVVYRLLTTGTLDEKIFQRQMKKGDIAATMMGGGGGAGEAGGGGGGGGKQAGGKFSKDELKQLFTLRTDTRCDTSDILHQAAAQAGGGSVAQKLQRQKQQAAGDGGGEENAAVVAAAAAADFQDVSASCGDALLCAAISAGWVTWVHLDRQQAAAADKVEETQQPEAEGSAGTAAAADSDPGAGVGSGELAPGGSNGSSELELELEVE